MNDGVLLSAASLERARGGDLSDRVLATLRRARLLGWFNASTLRITAALAERHGLVGELQDVHAIAARILPPAEASLHVTAVTAIQASYANSG
jgi:hypothetical protein